MSPEKARGPVVGHITRGTTGTNRLRRVDRWIARHRALRTAADPLVIDLGYGASAVTALELEARLRAARDDVDVIGLEIDPDRVARARAQLAEVHAGRTPFAPDARVSFARGGFEVPLPHGRRPAIIRAFNVLRQYDESAVADAWQRMCARLAPGGLLVEGTCDELGRISTWVAVDPQARPLSLSISLRLDDLEMPSIAAERLPKALIHRNVPGEKIHDFFAHLDEQWMRAAPASTFGPTQRWRAAIEAMAASDEELGPRSRWRLGEVTIPWERVAPR